MQDRGRSLASANTVVTNVANLRRLIDDEAQKHTHDFDQTRSHSMIRRRTRSSMAKSQIPISLYWRKKIEDDRL